MEAKVAKPCKNLDIKAVNNIKVGAKGGDWLI